MIGNAPLSDREAILQIAAVIGAYLPPSGGITENEAFSQVIAIVEKWAGDNDVDPWGEDGPDDIDPEPGDVPPSPELEKA